MEQLLNIYLGTACLVASTLIMCGVVIHQIYHEYKSPHKNK